MDILFLFWIAEIFEIKSWKNCCITKPKIQKFANQQNLIFCCLYCTYSLDLSSMAFFKQSQLYVNLFYIMKTLRKQLMSSPSYKHKPNCPAMSSAARTIYNYNWKARKNWPFLNLKKEFRRNLSVGIFYRMFLINLSKNWKCWLGLICLNYI